MAEKAPIPKRANRTVRLGESVGKALDPALRKRGFASRDLLSHWAAIAPNYAAVTLPDRLAWPRRTGASSEGATLYLRCREGHAMAVEMDGPAIASAINQYFGYFLVAAVKPAAMPLVPSAPALQAAPPPLTPEQNAAIARRLEPVADDGLRAALAQLGAALMQKR